MAAEDCVICCDRSPESSRAQYEVFMEHCSCFLVHCSQKVSLLNPLYVCLGFIQIMQLMRLLDHGLASS